jgi:Na+/proline symporter
MRAVIWTDVMQFTLYILGSIAAFFILLHKIPGGWHTVTQTAAAAGGKFSVFDFTFSLTKSYTFWSGLIGGTFLTMASHGVDQTMVQRLLSARSERESKIALVASGFIVFVQFALFLTIGVMLFVFAQHFALPVPQGDPDKMFPAFIVHEMPVGMVGIVLASIFAVAMSNASGSLNSLASSTVMDFGGAPVPNPTPAAETPLETPSPAAAAPIGTRSPAAEAPLGTRSTAAGAPVSTRSPAETLRRSRFITLGWGLVLGFLGLVRWGGVLVAGLTIASITYGGLLGVFLLGTWNRRANETGALTGFVAGIATMILVNRFTPLAFTWYVLAGTIVTFTIGSLASLLVSGE